MMRSLFALALASLSYVAGAAPAILPLDVKVTNPVLPVEVSNADPIPVSVIENASAARALGHWYGSFADKSDKIFQVPPGKRAVVTDIIAWTLVPAATLYVVKEDSVGANVIASWYMPAVAGYATGAGQTEVHLTTGIAFEAGEYLWLQISNGEPSKATVLWYLEDAS